MITNKKQQKGALLQGGWSSERAVSLVSGAAVASALTRLGHQVMVFDPQQPLADFITALTRFAPDVCFNALHGQFGEDGGIQALLEWLKIPYTHSGRLASSLAMNKEATVCLFRQHGLPVAASYSVSAAEIKINPPFLLPRPLVVKPVFEGSSVGLYIIGDNDPTPDFSNWSFGPVLVEQYIPGRELTVAVLEQQGEAIPLTVTELQPISGVYDYESKYQDGKTRHICPAVLDKKLQDRCLQLATTAHRLVGARGVSRTDFRYDPKADQLVILEINTQPGMTSLSLVPEQAQYCGIDFDKLVAMMLSTACLKE
ncbi:MAG: D-alanine--D-alanine ligase [Alphaproteobacteria bacterium]|nr:D-alanine--D-alanine ligase [Alphaproteobacteria bacterium]